jgi:hypothetical protein
MHIDKFQGAATFSVSLSPSLQFLRQHWATAILFADTRDSEGFCSFCCL